MSNPKGTAASRKALTEIVAVETSHATNLGQQIISIHRDRLKLILNTRVAHRAVGVDRPLRDLLIAPRHPRHGYV